MVTNNTICYFCNNKLNYLKRFDANISCTFYKCYICGHYAIEWQDERTFDKDIYASFLFHKHLDFASKIKDKSYIFIGSQGNYELLIKDNNYKDTILFSYDEVENWYPKKFSEKIDQILLTLAHLSKYTGYPIPFKEEEIFSLLFLKRFDNENKFSIENIGLQLSYILSYLSAQNLITKKSYSFIILPAGWKRIDELQKNQTNNKQAFVAMCFTKKNKKLREAIRIGIENAGYIPRFIDEKIHNNQIVPEILYEIKQSKFLIAEFSDNNNGAYYEAGYAAGLGKEVIHICNEDKFKEQGHFDIKQKSTILYNSISEISEALEKHIIATIL